MKKTIILMQPMGLILGLAVLTLGVGPCSAPDKAAVAPGEQTNTATITAAVTPPAATANADSAPKSGSYMPGGFAVCPCMDTGDGGAVFVVSDNTNGRILQVASDKLQETGRSAVIVSGLGNAGDVDIAEDGRAFVYVDGGTAIERYFGLTAFVHDGKGYPLVASEVVVDIGLRSVNAKTDGQGYFTVLDLLPAPPTEIPMAIVTVTNGNESRQFPIQLNECCQTVREIVFAPEEAKKGTININVNPSGLAGAQWRIKGVDVWLDATQPLQIFPGEFTVIFSDVDGFKTPDPVTFLVAEDVVATIDANYEPQ